MGAVFQLRRHHHRIRSRCAGHQRLAAIQPVTRRLFKRTGLAGRPGIAIGGFIVRQHNAAPPFEQARQARGALLFTTALGQQAGTEQHTVEIRLHHQMAPECAHQQPALHGPAFDAAIGLGHRQPEPAHIGKALPHRRRDAMGRFQAVGPLEKIIFM
ncbi:hypothetical protein D3C85_1264610 [compost metagenome]